MIAITKRKLKRLALCVGVPVVLYAATKNWGFDVQSYTRTDDNAFAEIYKQPERAGSQNDCMKGGSSIEGLLFGRDTGLQQMRVSLLKFAHNARALEDRTSYYNNLQGQRRFIFGEIDSGRYVLSITDAAKNVKFARVLNIRGDKDYHIDVRNEGILKKAAQKMHTYLAKIQFKFNDYLVRERYLN